LWSLTSSKPHDVDVADAADAADAADDGLVFRGNNDDNNACDNMDDDNAHDNNVHGDEEARVAREVVSDDASEAEEVRADGEAEAADSMQQPNKTSGRTKWKLFSYLIRI
jgi:hypothetical protein